MVINNVVSSTRLQDGSEYFLLHDRMVKEKKRSQGHCQVLLSLWPTSVAFANGWYPDNPQLKSWEGSKHCHSEELAISAPSSKRRNTLAPKSEHEENHQKSWKIVENHGKPLKILEIVGSSWAVAWQVRQVQGRASCASPRKAAPSNPTSSWPQCCRTSTPFLENLYESKEVPKLWTPES